MSKSKIIMAGSVNKVILIGNLGADPEVRTLTNGAKVARLRLATNETYTNKEGQKITNTEWHSVNVWRGLAEITERYLHKGDSVYVEGRLRTRSYDDKDGVTRYVTEIEADNLTMLGGRPENSGGEMQEERPAVKPPKKQSQAPSEPVQDSDEDDDLPF